MNKHLLLAVTFLSWMQLGAAADVRAIRLMDGGVIQGEIQSFDGKQYTIKTDSLGIMRIDASEIAAIVAPSSAGVLRSPTAGFRGGEEAATISPRELANLTRKMVNDDEIMVLIHALRSDPQVQAILDDQTLMQAVLAGDVETLSKDPRIKALMENPAVQKIQSKALSQ
jgi:hypothetical protein